MTRHVVKMGKHAQVIGVPLTGEVKHLYGKGTASDPVCAVLHIREQFLTVRVGKLKPARGPIEPKLAPPPEASDG